MQRGILAYVVILAILIVLAIYLFATHGGSGAQTTLTTTLFTNGTPTTSVGGNGTANTSSITFTTTTVYFASCISKNASVAIPNGNFSTGTYADWNATGPGFGSAPFNLTKANSQGAYYAAPWSGYNDTYAATTYNTGVALQAGNLTSEPFPVSQLYLNFKLISSQSSSLYVQILKAGKPVITDHYNTYVSPKNVANPQSTFVNASIPLGTLLCQNVSIKLVAGVTGTSSQGKGYIAAGDFYLGRNPALNATQPVNQTIAN